MTLLYIVIMASGSRMVGYVFRMTWSLLGSCLNYASIGIYFFSCASCPECYIGEEELMFTPGNQQIQLPCHYSGIIRVIELG